MYWFSLEMASLVAQTVKRLSTMWKTWVRFLGREDPLEKEMGILSSTIAWKIPWTEEPGRLQSMGLRRVRHDWATSLWVWGSQSKLLWCDRESQRAKPQAARGWNARGSERKYFHTIGRGRDHLMMKTPGLERTETLRVEVLISETVNSGGIYTN